MEADEGIFYHKLIIPKPVLYLCYIYRGEIIKVGLFFY